MLATLVATVALAGGGQAEPRICPQPRPAEPRTTRMDYYVERRRELGFRHGRKYIRKLIRRGIWEYDVGDIPVTRRENRYLRLRDRLGFEPRMNRYLRQHTGLSGGLSIQDDWPREPYLLVRLTRDRVRHTRALRRLARFPDNLRTVRVARSERQLRRLQNRISFRAHEADGFHVQGVGVDIDTGTVEIDLITKRSDHLAYFRARYGPHVRTTVIATELTSPECAPIVSYSVEPDGSLRIVYETGGGAELDHVELVEHADRVELGVVMRAPNGARTDDLRFEEHVVALATPLAGRALIDATTGRRVVPRDLCAPEPSRLDQFIEVRRERGLRSGRDFVRRMLRRRIPYTRAEQRYVQRRQGLERRGERIGVYARRHRGTWGGTTVEGRFPRRPYLLVRFTRGHRQHRARLRALVEGPVRTGPARRTDAELEAVRERISDASQQGGIDLFAPAGVVDPFAPGGGFLIASLAKDPAAGQVVAELYTRRADHAAYFADRFGPVRTVLAGRGDCDR